MHWASPASTIPLIKLAVVSKLDLLLAFRATKAALTGPSHRHVLRRLALRWMRSNARKENPYHGRAACHETEPGIGGNDVAITERLIDAEEREEFANYGLSGMRVVGASASSSPKEIVASVHEYVVGSQRKRDGAVAGSSSKDDDIHLAIALGVVWGDQLARAFGWEWTHVMEDGHERFGVVTRDRSLAIYATHFVKECLDRPSLDCTILLFYNMIESGRFSAKAPGGYLDVMRSVRHIVPPR